MLAKDEADIIEPVLRHLDANCDGIIVADNGSTDGTFEIVSRLREELPGLELRGDGDPAYRQSAKTTALAMAALEQGYGWVVPCDADEVWHANDGRRLGDYLDGVAPDVQIVEAPLYNHLPTAIDPDVENPLRRIGFRQRQHGQLPKVACRLRPDLEIGMGNHSARTSGTALAAGGLSVRHFTWRTPEQYVRKIRNGYLAYAAAGPELAGYGGHWKLHGDPADPTFDERVAAHFYEWFHSARPYADASLIWDPAPAWGQLDDVAWPTA